MNIENHDPILIGYASSETTPPGKRWTEIAVFYLNAPGPGGKRWVAQVRARSTVEGERNKLVELNAGTLERALKIVDETDLGVSAREQAFEWAEDNRVIVENGRGRPFLPANDAEALAWLYGELPEGETFPRLVERDFGAKRSTVRMQMVDERDVMIPLRSVVRFIDRNAFRHAIKGDSNRG